MPPVVIKDPEGNSIRLHDYKGKLYALIPFVDLDEALPQLTDMPCRDDDVLLLAYPKAGTHWTWEMANMLLSGDGNLSTRQKGHYMLEATSVDFKSSLPSVRVLNTHLPPEFCPKDLIKRKCKIILVQRNPKDILVSFYHHTRKSKMYDYDGSWSGYFELHMAERNDYGSWFDWTKKWEDFFTANEELPVLRLNYEDMKTDINATIEKLGEFLGVPCEQSYRETVAAKCGFQSMKAVRQLPEEIQRKMVKGSENPSFRKGIIGDWKTHFTVAQSERFDKEFEKQMRGFTFDFKKYM